MRRADWGWTLVHPSLELQSLVHRAQPPAAVADRALLGAQRTADDEDDGRFLDFLIGPRRQAR